MTHNPMQSIRRLMLAGLLLGTSLTFWNCSSGGNKENSSTTGAEGTATADSSVFGRQGDTMNSSSMDVSQQAPPDSASARGAVVPAEVQVKAKQR